MTLADLLDTLRRDTLRDVSDAVSGDSDQLWSDTSLIRYIDEAQRRFARRTLCIRDGSSPISRFTTAPFQQDYQLDPAIISIASMRSVGNGTWVGGTYVAGVFDETTSPPTFTLTPSVTVQYPDQADLTRTGHTAQRMRDGLGDGRPWDVNNLSTLRPGKPLTFESDETMGEVDGSAGVVSVRLYPIPDATYAGCVMQMRVARLPRARLTPANLEAVPEIPEDYHVDMLDWAAYRALRVVDHDAGTRLAPRSSGSRSRRTSPRRRRRSSARLSRRCSGASAAAGSAIPRTEG